MERSNSKKRKNPPGFMDAITSPRKKARVQYSPLSRANGMVCRPSNQVHGRRLVIQKLSDLPQLPSDFQESTWKKLSAAISAVQEMRPIEDSTESLYHCVKDLCTHKVAAKAYQSLQKQCTEHLETVRTKLTNSCRSDDGMSFLLEVENTWSAHCTQIRIIRDIFLYLDRTYVMQEADAKSIWDLGLTLFRTVALRDAFVVSAIVDQLLKEIEKERSGETVRRSLLQTLVRMFTTLEIYQHTFEPPLLEQSRTFYTAKGSERINSQTPSQYLSYVEKQLHEEAERVVYYLDQSSGPPLCQLVHELLVTQHASVILDRSFDDLMSRHAADDLKILYRLFHFTGLLNQLKERFKNYVRETGLRIVMDTKKDEMMIDDILTLKRKIDTIHQTAFERNQEFAHSLKDAFEYFINQRQNKPAELMARFIDNKLRRGQKNFSESELEHLLDEVINIFRSIQAKDIFQGHYRNHLSTRLLTEKTASLDLEKSLISKLKQECGSAFTSKLESMFKDMNISKDLMSDFRLQHPAVELTVNVLSRGIWPEWPVVELNMPSYLTEQQRTFEHFYNQKYNGRKLTWQNAKTHCVLSGAFTNGNKIFLTSLLQALVLMLFNDNARLSYREIRTRIASSDEKMLKLSVQSLAFNKSMRLLLKGTKGPLTDDTLFAVNEAFTHKLVRMKVNQIQEKETEEEREKTNTSVFLERQYQIDAAIVRIMKTRKKLRHSNLLSVLYEQLRFPFTPLDIKKRIESLIEREYLERDSDDSQVYSYLA